MRHASFFSGVGGLDLGFERAGIHTVSVSEIDPYACAVLAERFPDAPNLGSITEVEANAVPEADIWSGGFPCQDLSVAGKRAGFAGKRSSLAFTFLDLVEQRRPRWIVLENVPGLFSSNNGADFGRLLNEMEQLGYGVAWRTLDARYFGVPQRRRRVFIVASLGSDRSAEVLFECEGCERHSSASRAERQNVARGTQDCFANSNVRSSSNANGVRAADGLARRMDNQQPLAYQTRVDEKNGNFSLSEVEQANSLSALWPADTSHRSMTLVQAVIQDAREMANKTQNGAGFSTEDISYTLTGVDRPAVFRKSARAQNSEDSETWVEDGVANTLNSFDVGDVRTTHAIVGGTVQDDSLLPLGLDSHRYRCCGNGVVASVAEWIGRRLVEVDADWQKEGK